MNLKPYQVEGAQWLASKTHALLADDMGLGKTAQAISACDLAGAQRIVVLCPAVAKVNWAREVALWSPGSKVCILDGKGPRDLPADEARFVICNYDILGHDHVQRAFNCAWDVLICDESHLLKSVTAARASKVLGGKGIVHRAARTWLLSGTPAPNHAGELWVPLFVFGKTVMKYDAFVARYCHTEMVAPKLGAPPRLVVRGNRAGMLPELRALLSEIVLRRTLKTAGLDLPPIDVRPLFVDASDAGEVDVMRHFTKLLGLCVNEKQVRDEVAYHLKADVGRIEAALAADAPLSAKDIEDTATLRRYVGLQKASVAAALIAAELEAKAYDKIVVFAHHKAVIEELDEALKPWGPVTLYGGTPEGKRQERIDRFQKDPDCHVFIGQTIAAGTAITLTAADQVMLLEQDWVPANNAQAVKRCHRIGQDRPVFVRVVTLADSIDERIQAALTRKTRGLIELGLSEEQLTT